MVNLTFRAESPVNMEAKSPIMNMNFITGSGGYDASAVHSQDIRNVVVLTQAEYEATEKSSNTLYLIVEDSST